MKITIPDLPQTIELLLDIRSSFDGRTKTIKEWLAEHRNQTKNNLELLNQQSEENDIKILSIFIRDLMVRGILGEAGERFYQAFCEIIHQKSDLTDENYQKVLMLSRYRWGSTKGAAVISAVVNYFGDTLAWNWSGYFNQAEANKDNNFIDDSLLKIKNIGFKVRDLALSNFNPNYAAFDLHVTRVVARIGLLAYGWDITEDKTIEFGTNPSDPDNYLFLHRLFLHLAALCNNQFTPVDLDRIFWHLGRSKCKAKTKCETCPINKNCLTGIKRAR